MNTEATLKTICNFIELEYDQNMLSYYKRTPKRLKEHKGRSFPDGTHIDQDQRIRQQQGTTEPPDPARLFAWRSAMSESEIARFAVVAGDLLSDLGYEL